jgi:hypothetical protein
MPRFSYRTFVWIFAIGNAIVWFFILFGLGHLVYEHFAEETGLTWEGAWAFFALTPFVSSVLASQGAIVNLREQYLIGRFTPPPSAGARVPPPRNVWLMSARHALPAALIAAVLTTLVLQLVPATAVTHAAATYGMGAIGATITLVLARTAADREFRRFHFHLGSVGRRPPSGRRYIVAHLVLPWVVINGILNAVFAWMLHHQSEGPAAPLVAIGDLRHDLVLSTFLICVFTALAVIPEVETDFALGTTPADVSGHTAMPPLWTRYAIALGLAAAVWILVTLFGQLVGGGISLLATMVLKSLGSALLSGLAAAQCGRWALARCLAHTAATVLAPRQAAIA